VLTGKVGRSFVGKTPSCTGANVLVKLTPGFNFINILIAALLPILFSKKNTTTVVNGEQLQVTLLCNNRCL